MFQIFWPSLFRQINPKPLCALGYPSLECLVTAENYELTRCCELWRYDIDRTPEKKLEPRVDWVSCSSAYKKEEIDQPGAPRAKKITKVDGCLYGLYTENFT